MKNCKILKVPDSPKSQDLSFHVSTDKKRPFNEWAGNKVKVAKSPHVVKPALAFQVDVRARAIGTEKNIVGRFVVGHCTWLEAS